MTALTLTRDEAARLDTDGQVVLYRPGAVMVSTQRMTPDSNLPGAYLDPPAEFTAAAEPCKKCLRGRLPCRRCGDFEGWRWQNDGHNGIEKIYCSGHLVIEKCPDCLDGKRRIAAVVECDSPLVTGIIGTWHDELCCDGTGLVRAATVVVEWGPAGVVEALTHGPPPTDAIEVTPGGGVVLRRVNDHHTWHSWIYSMLTLPPDVDPQSLVGQYALCVRKVSDDC